LFDPISHANRMNPSKLSSLAVRNLNSNIFIGWGARDDASSPGKSEKRVCFRCRCDGCNPGGPGPFRMHWGSGVVARGPLFLPCKNRCGERLTNDLHLKSGELSRKANDQCSLLSPGGAQHPPAPRQHSSETWRWTCRTLGVA
jgi:hypothetical protein